MVKVKQRFDDSKIEDLGQALSEKLNSPDIRKTIRPGMEIALAVGSRGIDRLAELTAVTVKFLKERGYSIYRAKHGKSWWRHG